MRDPDSSLVVDGVRRYGRLAARPTVADPLAAFRGLGRSARRLRLKEWIGFTLLHPDIYSSLILQDAHYLASSELYVHDRAAAVTHQHAVNARGGSLRLPTELLGSICTMEKPGYRVHYDFAGDGSTHRIAVDIAARDKAAAVSGELELDASAASAPLSVSSRLPGGSMYTHKAMFPVSGTLRVGGREIVFDPSRDLAILDEHRSLLPYRTRWVWGTFALPTADGVAGANFVDRPELSGQEEESCLWFPGACEPLSEIAFRSDSPDDPAAVWQIASADGRLDAVFRPEGRKQVKHQLGVFAIDYFQMFGRYSGTIRSAAGATTAFDDVHGVCESMQARL